MYEGCEEDATHLVHGRKHVVRGTAGFHLRGLRYQVVLHLIKADVEHDESEQDSAPLQRSTKFANQLTTPGNDLAAMLELVLGFSAGESKTIPRSAEQYPTRLSEDLGFVRHP
ncbi:hypothetical protein PMIN06_013015 [Paraphaeosphaeria minitans]